MEWIPITEQPLPMDGKNIMVTIKSGIYSHVDTICFFRLLADDDPKWWYSFPDNPCEVSDCALSNITAWMYYPAPYEG